MNVYIRSPLSLVDAALDTHLSLGCISPGRLDRRGASGVSATDGPRAQLASTPSRDTER